MHRRSRSKRMCTGSRLLLHLLELEEYLRGRSKGEIPGVIVNTLNESGFSDDSIMMASDPVDGTRRALDWAEEGDFLLLLALGDRGRVLEVLDDLERSNKDKVTD